MLISRLKALAKNPAIRKLIDTIRDIIRPPLPQRVGLSYYQKASFWTLQNNCPCDIEFLEYLQRSPIESKTIFHFGTGGHHIVGLENQEFDHPNEIIGITASAPEHRAYIKLVLKNAALAKYYKVLFADIYSLTANILPMFDIVTLFHLCEFYFPENTASIHHNDTSLVQLFLDKLNPNGRLLFYTGSSEWGRAQPIVQALELAGKIQQSETYKTLLVYTKKD
jgi:SAM-dependent methyltransferase